MRSKSNVMTIRLTDEQKAMLSKKSDKLNLKPSKVVRLLIAKFLINEIRLKNDEIKLLQN